MSFQSDQFKAEIEQHRLSQAYYNAIRRPGLERFTFAVALSASIAMAGRMLGFWLVDHGFWVSDFFGLSLAAYAFLDTLISKVPRPSHIESGSFSPAGIYEKFSMQGRALHLLAILMLPAVAKLIAAIFRYGA